MTDDTEKRLTELETVVWDIPNLLSTRLARFDTEFASLRAAIADNTARLTSIERAMTGLQIDMRDLRGGVTRQLLEQDRRLATIELKLGEQERRLATIDQKLGEQERRLGAIEQTLGEQLRRLGTIEQKIDGQDHRLGAIEQMLAEVLNRLPKP
jgi:chromosome segregation ATPase